MLNVLLTTKQAAPLIGISVASLENWRVRGEGPAYIKTAGKFGKVLYDPDDIAAWRSLHRFQSTAEADAFDRRSERGD